MTLLSQSSFPFSSLHQLPNINGDIVVFSHLRWDFVTQRPQHIMSRIAKNHNILFVEEPIPVEKESYGTAKVYSPQNNITVVQPRIHSVENGFQLAEIVDDVAKDKNFSFKVAWFYSAAFVDILRSVHYDLVVYDCMDELSAFAGADKKLIQKEKELLKKADVVFTGGRSLYQSKAFHHDTVYCYPSSVDQKHFEQVKNSSFTIPEDLRRLPRPIIGFYGVIDERIDYNLLSTLVRRLPQYSFVMIGPFAKIDPSTVPTASNLHYLGEKHYKDLPRYLKFFDAAMMPFARNDATKFISPTKTLEYLAAEKPVISTPITDVVRDYSKVVSIAQTPEEFAFRLVELVNEIPELRKKRMLLSRGKVSETSWDKTVHYMLSNMIQVMETKVTLHEYETVRIPHIQSLSMSSLAS